MSMTRPLNPMPREITEVMAATAEVREYTGTEQSKATLRLLRALEAQSVRELRNVAPEDLRELQGRLQSLMALIAVFEAAPPTRA